MARLSSSRPDCYERGTVAIEYAIILPVLLLLILGLIDTARLLWTYTTLIRAAEAAARCGAINVNDCGTAAQIQNRAVTEAWGLTIKPAAFTVTSPSCGVQVRATYAFTFIIPGLGSVAPLGTRTMTATACYPT